MHTYIVIDVAPLHWRYPLPEADFDLFVCGVGLQARREEAEAHRDTVLN